MAGKIAKFERRLTPRAAVPAVVTVFRSEARVGEFAVENLSAGGVLLTGAATLNVGEMLRVLLQLQGHLPIAIHAQVLRREDRGGGVYAYAVTFRDLSAKAEDLIQESVLLALERQRKRPDAAVLVVDDSAEVCLALERDLRAMGRRAFSAVTPLDAVRHLLDAQAGIETAVVDLYLGQADGMDLLAYLADDLPKVRRVIMSGTLREDQLQAALVSGRAQAILHKPWDRGALADAIAPS
jgi:CheY-like chemotaxis protein